MLKRPFPNTFQGICQIDVQKLPAAGKSHIFNTANPYTPPARFLICARHFRNCIYLEKIELPGCEIRLFGLADRQRELPPLAKQIVMERLNCFKTDGDNVLLECTGNITELLVAYGIRRIGENVFRDRTNALSKTSTLSASPEISSCPQKANASLPIRFNVDGNLTFFKLWRRRKRRLP